MAAIRTQREIRQRAPWWLIALLALNFGLMTYDARDVATKQRKIRTMAQTVADPFERAGSGVGNWIGGFFCRFGGPGGWSRGKRQFFEKEQKIQKKVRRTRPKPGAGSMGGKTIPLCTQLPI